MFVLSLKLDHLSLLFGFVYYVQLMAVIVRVLSGGLRRCWHLTSGNLFPWDLFVVGYFPSCVVGASKFFRYIVLFFRQHCDTRFFVEMFMVVKVFGIVKVAIINMDDVWKFFNLFMYFFIYVTHSVILIILS